MSERGRAIGRLTSKKLRSDFLDIKREILGRIRATSSLYRDVDALRRLAGAASSTPVAALGVVLGIAGQGLSPETLIPIC